MKSVFRLKTVTLLLAVVLLAAGCGGQDSQGDANSNDGASSGGASGETIDLRFMAAPQSGAWYPLAVAITEMLKDNMENLGQVSIEPGGGVANVVGVNEGKAQVGFSQAAPSVDGYKGNPPFEAETPNIRYMLSLFPHKTHIVVLEDSGIDSVEDLKGKRINVGTKGLLTEDLARRLLDVYGMSYDDMQSVQYLSFADSVEQMKDGRLDAMFWTVPVPFAVLTDLSQSRDMKLLPIPEDKRKELVDQNPGFIETTIEAGTYKGVDYDVETIQSPLVVLANKDASEDLVYELTKTIIEGFEELQNVNPALKALTPEDLVNDIGIPMHPGTEKYLEENGLK